MRKFSEAVRRPVAGRMEKKKKQGKARETSNPLTIFKS